MKFPLNWMPRNWPGLYAERHAQRAGRHPEQSGRRISQRTPYRRRQRRGRVGPESGGAFAGEERTITAAASARIPPWHELIRAVELRHHHRAGPAPITLEGKISKNARRESKRDEQENHGPP